MLYIYILKLVDNKYYVGKTIDPTRRYLEHVDGGTCSWTDKYKPISIERIIENADIFDEDKYTKEYMAKYGIDNVRGGSYVTIDINQSQRELLKHEIWGAQNACMRCGYTNHFIQDCNAKID